MYIALLVIPVPEANMDAYRRWAANSVAIFKRYGCLDVIDGRGDFVPHGKRTDFYRAVDAQPGETIVVSLQLWPDKDSFFASEARMHADNALEFEGEPPFDPGRLIHGCFAALDTGSLPA